MPDIMDLLMDSRVAEVSDAILRYLAMHPDAADSATGILQWWLKDLDFSPSSLQLREALTVLIEKGLVQRDQRASGIDIYSAYVRPQ